MVIFDTLISFVHFLPGLGFLAFENFKEFFITRHGLFTRIHPETSEVAMTVTGGLVCGAVAGVTSQSIA